jgi:hypothetical protein
MGSYRLEASFEIDAPIERVWQAMGRPQEWGGAWPIRGRPHGLRVHGFPTDLLEWRVDGRIAGTAVWRLEEIGTTTVCQCAAEVTVPAAGPLDGVVARAVALRHAQAVTRAVHGTAALLGVPARKVVCRRLDRGVVREAVGALAALWLLSRRTAGAR